MSEQQPRITLKDGDSPAEATIRDTGITVAEVINLFNDGKAPLEVHPELEPMDLVDAGSFYGNNSVAFREQESE